MAKKQGPIGKFFAEFKKFITRGNVLDMSVGVIVGGAFTGIVNGLSNFILKPLINWLLAAVLGKDGLSGAITMLSPAYTDVVDANGVATGEKLLDLANSIYIDWGAFISAIINFLLIAIVLFTIVKIINGFAEASKAADAGLKTAKQQNKAIKAIKKAEKVSYKQAKELYEAREAEAAAAKAAEEAAVAEAAAAAEAEAARIAEEKAMANTVLLQQILEVLKNK